MTSSPDRPPLADLAGVRYDGASDVRVLTVEDLARVGVTVDDDLSWTPGSVVPVSRLNAATVDVLAADGDFTLLEKEKDGEGA